MGGIEGAKCDSDGAKIQKIAENGLLWHFFPSDWGKVGGGQSLLLGEMPPCPPPLDAATHKTSVYHLGILYEIISVNFRARQTNRKNKNLAHKTFQEARIWEDHCYIAT